MIVIFSSQKLLSCQRIDESAALLAYHTAISLFSVASSTLPLVELHIASTFTQES